MRLPSNPLRQEHEVTLTSSRRLDTLSGTDTLLRMATREPGALLRASTVVVVGPLVPPFMDDPGPAEPDPMSRGQEADHDD